MSHSRTVVRAESLKDQVYNMISTEIIASGDKDKIYSIKDFAKQYDVSRTPVREAVLQLAEEGIITILPNTGFILKPVTPEEIDDLLFARTCIDSFAAHTFATKVKDKDPEALKKVAELRAILDDPDLTRPEVDKAFHMGIVTMTDSNKLISFYKSTLKRTETYWNLSRSLNVVLYLAQKEHNDILTAIENGDPMTAFEASKKHMERAKINLVEEFKDRI